ncbi:hypothetical protein ACMZ6Z_00600 [Streptococcus pluranimalium]|uniref:hypothetical protein n=1 Tax=Streptococcus pluranimalium TaxID=82348 RepID=UPI0039FD5795
MKVVVLVVLGLYLAVVAFAAVLGSLGAKIITKRNMWLTLFSVLVSIAFTYIYLGQGNSSAIYGIAGGLFGISAIAISNATQMAQKPNPLHHLVRMGINLVFLVLLYWVFTHR